MTSDQAAFTAAFAAILAGIYAGLQLGNKPLGYLVTGALLVPPNSTIRGCGPGVSVMKTATNQMIFKLLSVQKALIDGVGFIGNSTGANQNGIESGYLGGDGTDDLIVTNCTFTNMGGRGLSNAYGTGNSPGPTISNCHAINCGVEGFGAYSQMQFTGCTARGCAIGLHVGSGNITFDGGDLGANTAGVRIDGGGNSAHGIISNTNINHCSTYSVDTQTGVSNGMTFSGCHLYDSTLHVIDNTGLVDFVGCIVDPVAYTFSATSNVRFANCSFPMGSANTDNGLGDVEFLNCRGMIGDLPAFIAARMRPLYTFPSDADQSLSNALSRAAVLDIQAGVVTATRTLTYAGTPAAGERRRVINRTAQTVNIGFASGAGLAIPTLNVLDFAGDGSKAVCELLGSCVATATGVINPATLSLTGWVRGSYAAAPWAGTASAGSSGSHSFISNGADPVVGTSLAGFASADFAGTHYLKDNVATADVYITPTAYRLHFRVFVTGTSAPAGSVLNDPGLMSESGGNWGVTINSSGVHVYHGSAAQVAASAGALSTGAWHDIDVLYNGANITVTVDGVAGTPVASATTGTITGAVMYLGSTWNNAAKFNGMMEDVIIANTSLVTTTAAQFKAYANARYGQSL